MLQILSGLVSAIVAFFLPTQFIFVPVSVVWLVCMAIAVTAAVFRKYLFLLFFVLGVGWTNAVVDVAVPVVTLPEIGQLTVKVEALPEFRQFAAHIQATVIDSPNPAILPQNSRVLLKWYGVYPVIQAGDRWQLQVRTIRWQAQLEEGETIFSNWLLRHNAIAEFQVKQGVLLEQNPAIFDQLNRLRFQVAEQLTVQLASEPMQGMVSALGLGYQSDITADQWDVLNATGTTHLMAISGLHVGLFTAWVYILALWAGKFLLRYFPALVAQRFAALVAIVGAVVYAALAGFSIPTQRALVMSAVGLFFIYRGLRFSALDILALAMVLVLLIAPAALLTPGFYLSFAAVAAIFWLVLHRVGVRSHLLMLFKIQWVLSLLMLPLTLFIFERTSWVALLANLFAIPWVSWAVVPLAILSVLMGLIDPALSVIAGQWAAILLQPLWSLLEYFARLNSGLMLENSTGSDLFSAGWMLCLIPAVLFATLPRGFPGRIVGLLLFLPWFVLVFWP